MLHLMLLTECLLHFIFLFHVCCHDCV